MSFLWKEAKTNVKVENNFEKKKPNFIKSAKVTEVATGLEISTTYRTKHK